MLQCSFFVCLLCAFLVQDAIALRYSKHYAGTAQLKTINTSAQVANKQVDVLYAGDRRVLIGIRTAITSTVAASLQPARLRLHVAIEEQDATVFRKALGMRIDENERSLRGGALLKLHMIDVQELKSLYAVHKLREDGASNYVRYFADKYLPEDATQCIWLDADVIVQHDVADLADTLSLEPMKTVAVARYPSKSWGFNGSRTIEGMFTNKTWAVEHVNESVLTYPLWNIGVLAFNMAQFRKHTLRERAIEWIKLNQKLNLYEGGSQTPFDLAALVHPTTEDTFLEVDAEWNCWWGFVGNLRTEEELNRCKIIHFAGADKPWNAGESVPGYLRWSNAFDQAQQLFLA